MKGEPGVLGASAPCSQETGCRATIELRSTKRSLEQEAFYLKMNKKKWSKSIQKSAQGGSEESGKIEGCYPGP